MSALEQAHPGEETTPRQPAPPTTAEPSAVEVLDPFDPRFGGWFPVGEDAPTLANEYAGAVVKRLAQLRGVAAARGCEVDERPMRGLARVVALRRAVEAPGGAPRVLAQLGEFMRSEVVFEVATAQLDHSLRADLGLHLFAIRAHRGFATWVDGLQRVLRDKLTELVDPHTRADQGSLLHSVPEELFGYVLPDPWALHAGEVWCKEGKEPVKVCAGALLVSGIGQGADGAPLVELAWQSSRDDGSTRRMVERATIGSPSGVASLCGLGAPIAQEPRLMVRYLADLEARNRALLPPRLVVDRMGWVELADDQRAFVRGADVFGAEEAEVQVQPPPGVGAVFAGWKTKGSREAWSETVSDALGRFPTAGVVYLSALSAPLLEVLELPPFIVDLSGETSTGKSTALMLAASVWGSPSPTEGVFQTFGGTETALERLASAMGSLPLLLDETKLAGGRGAREVGRILYMLASGQGRQRGRPDGLRAQSVWRAPAILTGEAPIVGASNDAGTRARTLTLTEHPMGSVSDAGAIYAEHLEGVVLRHYGFAGPVLVQHLLREDWPRVQREFEAVRRSFGQGLGGGVAGRLAKCGAVLLYAGRLARELGLPCPCLEAVRRLLRTVAEAGGKDADRPYAALVEVVSWVGTMPARVDGSDDASDMLPSAGWIARRRGDEPLAVVAAAGRAYLDRQSFDVLACVRSWRHRGWLRTQAGRSTCTTTFTGGGRARCWVFTAKAVGLAIGDEDEATENPWRAP